MEQVEKDVYNRKRRERYVFEKDTRNKKRRDAYAKKKRHTGTETYHAVVYPVYEGSGQYGCGRSVPPKTLVGGGAISEPHVLPCPTICNHCGAKKFWKESKGFCCSDGEVKLLINETPRELRDLFISNTEESLNFRNICRTYNNHFAFTSFGVKYDKELCRMNRGVYTFRVQGQVYHFINDLKPKDDKPAYLQLYFYDTDHEVENRLQMSDKFDPNIVTKIIDILRVNPYSQFFRSLANLGTIETLNISLKVDPSLDQRVYNKPTASQVAGIWVDNDHSTSDRRCDICVRGHCNSTHRVNYYYGCYDPLQYPLLFPFGESGWHEGIPRCEKVRTTNRRRFEGSVVNTASSAEQLLDAEEEVLPTKHSRSQISQKEYYCYKLQIRECSTSILLHTGRLLQQYIVDMYVKIETARLDFFRKNQRQIRADLYQGVVDSVGVGETRGNKVGKRIVLPSSFIGGPRDSRKRYMDAMALVQRFGKPDIFLTMTCNPNWPEIRNELSYNDEAHNRPDLISRIFKAKLEELKNDLFNKEIFGPVAAYIYVIEFQKRGLPHAHFLIIMKPGSKITCREAVDDVACCEIPSVDKDEYLRSRVVKHMMHGPCGDLNPSNVCMEHDGTCKNKYPKEFCTESSLGSNSYPTYKRRDDGELLKIRGSYLDNRWVVPYNPFLLAKFDCHINVEIYSTVKAVKYLYKYVYKGHDRISFCVNGNEGDVDVDEISRYQNARWVSPPEAAWRIYGFNPFDNAPSVVSLQLHLENHHFVTFKDNENLVNVVNNEFLQRTMLTEYFRMNIVDEKAKDLLYKDFPTHFVWDPRARLWTRRKQKQVIGRIVSASPNEGERYYLRVLLNHIKGATCYDDLKQVKNVTAATFREAASLRGLLNEDENCELCMAEAVLHQMPFSLRRLFATILIFCAPNNPADLWLAYKDFMMEDYIARGETAVVAEQSTLKCINAMLEVSGKDINDYNLVGYHVSFTEGERLANLIVEETTNLDTKCGDSITVETLNAEQRKAYDIILERALDSKSGAFFIDGPGGTGKTYLYKCLLKAVRTRHFVALATASSGVAASLLPGGRTAHSRFKIPLEVAAHISCSITKQSALGKLLIMSRLIIWDEAPMVHRFSVEAFHRQLQDLMENELPFGGKVVVFGGDFRQILPVIPRGSRQDIIEGSLLFSPLWPSFERMSLVQNMRAQEDAAFSKYLLLVGDGKVEPHSCGMVKLLCDITIPFESEKKSFQLLLDSVFPNIFDYHMDAFPMFNRVILTPKNETVDLINNVLLERLVGERTTYYSFDEPLDETEHDIHEDFLNTLTPNGIPPHELVLKKNCPVILLRNINPSEGLCNGTRLICRHFDKNVVDAEIATGEYIGKRVFLPRIPFIPLESERGSVPFKRTQFPIRPCFAMTINKAQGQTLDFVGLYLPEPVFSHGQLYVALSRARSSRNIKVLMRTPSLGGKEDHAYCTQNVVYQEVFESFQSMGMVD